jgi:UDP-glucose 4-epimerase
MNSFSSIQTIVDTIKKGKNPVLNGDGTETRDLVYVTDVAKAIRHATTMDCNGQAVNIGTGEEFTMRGVVDMISEKLGKEVKPDFQGKRPGDISFSCSENTRATQLGFRMEYNLSKGLDELLK